MFQTIQGQFGLVVDIPEHPTSLLPIINDEGPFMQPYVEALDTAIRRGIVKEAGKYHVVIKHAEARWEVYRIDE